MIMLLNTNILTSMENVYEYEIDGQS